MTEVTDDIREHLAIAYGTALIAATVDDLYNAIAHAMSAVAAIRQLPNGAPAYERWKERVRAETQRRKEVA